MNMTAKQRIAVAVALLCLAALCAGIFWYLKRPEPEPQGLLVDGKKMMTACKRCFGGRVWHKL